MAKAGVTRLQMVVYVLCSRWLYMMWGTDTALLVALVCGFHEELGQGVLGDDQ
jgi:hypothetical protein